MAGLIDGSTLSGINLLDDKQLETIKLALKNLNEAHESYLLSEKVNDALFELLESDELSEEISSKVRTVLCAPPDLLDVSCDDEIEDRESCALLGLTNNSTDMETSRLTMAEDSQLFEKVHDKLLSWCLHGQTLEKVLRQREALLNDNQCQIFRLRRDLCRLIERRVALSKEMQTLQIDDGAASFIYDTVQELKSEGCGVPPTMTAEEAITRARKIERRVEAFVAGQDLDPVLALKKLHQMLDQETEANELARKRLNAKLASYKQLEEKSEFAIILKNYLKAKNAAVRWKWTLDELRISPDTNI
ncbi:hypothetical protein LSTR_LSTR013283 [Laodelphax striatellus]|uniref:Uncharacterized protein n=1 Tax=Laodelphax striatellus TaxID=195883 RepID=A0A482X3X2_LAOST|nr:hypothetical protein LSTR_LSTR013283 [Laodelphax striatellus]